MSAWVLKKEFSCDFTPQNSRCFQRLHSKWPPKNTRFPLRPPPPNLKTKIKNKFKPHLNFQRLQDKSVKSSWPKKFLENFSSNFHPMSSKFHPMSSNFHGKINIFLKTWKLSITLSTIFVGKKTSQAIRTGKIFYIENGFFSECVWPMIFSMKFSRMSACGRRKFEKNLPREKFVVWRSFPDISAESTSLASMDTPSWSAGLPTLPPPPPPPPPPPLNGLTVASRRLSKFPRLKMLKRAAASIPADGWNGGTLRVVDPNAASVMAHVHRGKKRMMAHAVKVQHRVQWVHRRRTGRRLWEKNE